VLRRQAQQRFGRGHVAARVLAKVIDVAVFAGSRLPARVTHTFAVIGGHCEWMLRPKKRRMLSTNLAHAVGRSPSSPEVRSLVRHEFVNEARRSADLLWAIGKPQELLDTFELEGVHHVNDVVDAGRGVVLASLHVGGWELAGAIPAAHFHAPASVIVADNWLAWAMQHVRRVEGLRTISRSAPLVSAVRALQRAEALLVLGEDATGAPPRKYAVRFGDAVAQLPAGVVSLARLGEAPIVPFSVLPMGPRRWKAVMEPPIEPPARNAGSAGEATVLQQLADRWTALLRISPQHWAACFPIAWGHG
jgi:lauroyl/myristoyl acyltransferase